MSKEGAIAPKERINIQYKAVSDDQFEEKELPLKLLILGDFGDFQSNQTLESRTVVGVNKSNLDDVMKAANVRVNMPNLIENDALNTSDVTLVMESLKDFEPDNLVYKIPQIKDLLELRSALVILKGPMGNIPEFRKALERIIKEKSSRDRFKNELINVHT